MMLFTIGHKESYDRGLAELGDEFIKLGRAAPCARFPKGYMGGCVFGDYEAAAAVAATGYAVYALETTVENTWEASDTRRYLINDARIVAVSK